MDPSSPVADTTAFYIQEIGALLFGTVFYFLYRQSKVVYFGLWAGAWVMRVMAAFFGFELVRTQHSGWLALYATFEFGFAIALLPTANLLFPIGALMAERFLYLPSVAFAIALVALLGRLKNGRYTATVVTILAVLYVGRTFARNAAWNNDLTLASADVQTANMVTT